MIFVFESIDNRNFIDCHDINPSGIPRFTKSPLIETLLRNKKVRDRFFSFDFENITVKNIKDLGDESYVIPSGVTHAPHDWCGFDGENIERCKNLFSHINSRYLQDLRNGKAFLLLDQCHEGYHNDWLFEWFHKNCVAFNISPKQIIYVTGNLEVEHQYNDWLKHNPNAEKLLVLGYPIFEAAVFEESVNLTRVKNLPPLITVEENINYKIENLQNIKLYNALQKRPRAHRIWLFNKLYFNGLLDDGINSMNFIDKSHTYYCNRFMNDDEYEVISKLLPVLPPSNENLDKELDDFSSMDSGKYQMRFNDDIMKKTWLTIVSEASFGEDTCFLSEKVFKPVVAGHPFIVYGNKYSLQNLKDLGYKTFHPFIDESYDTLDTWERLDAITESLLKIKKLNPEEKLQWYRGLTDILLHNQEISKRNSTIVVPQAFTKFQKYMELYNVL